LFEAFFFMVPVYSAAALGFPREQVVCGVIGCGDRFGGVGKCEGGGGGEEEGEEKGSEEHF
jgi:hypothetical protein